MGMPAKVWSKSLDLPDPEDAVEHTPRAPTEEQEQAVNELFNKVLSDKLPDGFGEGVGFDDLNRGRPRA